MKHVIRFPRWVMLPVLSMVGMLNVAAQLPDKRAHHELVYDEGTKTILLTGGSTPLNDGQSFQFFNDIWRYGANGWSSAGKAGDERSGIKLAYHTKDKAIYSYGGFLPGNQSSGQFRVLENGQWRVISDLAEMKGGPSRVLSMTSPAIGSSPLAGPPVVARSTAQRGSGTEHRGRN